MHRVVLSSRGREDHGTNWAREAFVLRLLAHLPTFEASRARSGIPTTALCGAFHQNAPGLPEGLDVDLALDGLLALQDHPAEGVSHRADRVQRGAQARKHPGER